MKHVYSTIILCAGIIFLAANVNAEVINLTCTNDSNGNIFNFTVDNTKFTTSIGAAMFRDDFIDFYMDTGRFGMARLVRSSLKLYFCEGVNDIHNLNQCNVSSDGIWSCAVSRNQI